MDRIRKAAWRKEATEASTGQPIMAERTIRAPFSSWARTAPAILCCTTSTASATTDGTLEPAWSKGAPERFTPPPRRAGLRESEWYSKSMRSEEHTSELQSRCNLVCRLLLEKKKTAAHTHIRQEHETRAAPRRGQPSRPVHPGAPRSPVLSDTAPQSPPERRSAFF